MGGLNPQTSLWLRHCFTLLKPVFNMFVLLWLRPQTHREFCIFCCEWTAILSSFGRNKFTAWSIVHATVTTTASVFHHYYFIYKRFQLALAPSSSSSSSSSSLSLSFIKYVSSNKLTILSVQKLLHDKKTIVLTHFAQCSQNSYIISGIQRQAG